MLRDQFKLISLEVMIVDLCVVFFKLGVDNTLDTGQ